MFKFIIPLVLVLFSFGCVSQNLEQAKTTSFAASYTATQSAVSLATRNGLIKQKDLEAVAQIVESIQGTTAQLENTGQIYSVLFPVVEAKAKIYLENPAQRDLVVSVIGSGLRSAEFYLSEHPELAARKDYWVAVVNSALKGAALGVRDMVISTTKVTLYFDDRRMPACFRPQRTVIV